MTRAAMLVLVSVWASGCGASGAPVENLPTGSVTIDTGQDEVRVDVSIAETTEARTLGLMGVTEMDAEAGMVFLETEPAQSGFWMKDTLIPLSIAFWDESDEILAILDMEPCRKEPCQVYTPGVTWIGALEVNRGFFDENGVQVGDTVHLQR